MSLNIINRSTLSNDHYWKDHCTQSIMNINAHLTTITNLREFNFQPEFSGCFIVDLLMQHKFRCGKSNQ